MAVLSSSIIYCLFILMNFANCIQDYCSMNNFITNSTYMQFIKEASVEEFAIVGKFKGLHCCAKGYRSIEWYKDGKPYPWPLMVSQLIIYPESANQTVYTQSVTDADSGNYTCLLKNDSMVHSHTIQLRVFDKIPDDPKITYVSPDTQIALGHRLRLFCEAFAGRVDLPDAYNEVVWRKIGHNGTIDDGKRIKQQRVSRETGQTFGTYLFIENLKHEDYGEYICEISKPGKTIEQIVHVQEKIEVIYLNPNPVPIGKLLLCVSAILFLCITALILNLQYGLPIRLRFKDTFASLEDDDGKLYDALILYPQKDAEIVVGVLVPTLETRYDYKCIARELPLNINNWFSYLQTEAEKSRRIIAVLSPSLLNDNWDSNSICQIIKQLRGLGDRITCITLKELPKFDNNIKNSDGETIKSILKTINIVNWARDDKFWLTLRLRLPPKRVYHHQHHSDNDNLTMMRNGENSSRLTNDSEEHSDSFV